jgi:AcrR family transcriptional regulator
MVRLGQGEGGEGDPGRALSDTDRFVYRLYSSNSMSSTPIPASPGLAAAGPGGPGPAPSGPAARGRPRSEAADRAILRAATELLAERGLAGMSMEEVAARAGVGKATIYRRWRSRGALALDAFMADFTAAQPLPDTGRLRGDLLTALRAWVKVVTRTPAGRILSGLIAAAQDDPELAAAWRARVVEPMRAQHRIMLRRAIKRGEIPASTDTDVALDLMYGAAYHRLLQGHRPLTDPFLRRVVDTIVRGIGTS